MKDQIKKLIECIEEEEDIKILFLIESGSRAWGWESEDSDYDIRGVYVQNHNVFKELKSQINKPINIFDSVDGFPDKPTKAFDIELWDLKKFLNLMRKSNPSVWEWLSSDIVYIDNPLREELKKEFIKGSSKFALKKHYVSMAQQNFNKYINQIGDTANLKKYVYILRSIACVNYIEEKDCPPPKNYKEVISYLPKEIFEFFEKIVNDKKKSESLKGKRNYEAEKYVVSFFDKNFERDVSKFGDLNLNYQKAMGVLKNG